MSSTMPNLIPGTTSPVDIKHLQLDYENPRLVDATIAKNDESFIRNFNRRSDLQELLSSMAENGYLDIEPLIVTLEKGKYVVLEGNRRLAALKLLRDPALAEKCRITLPGIRPEHQASLNSEIKVYCVESRKDARAFIGFKHINGPHKWDSYAKGKYATLWYREGVSSGMTVEEIARRIGDSHDTVSKMIRAYTVLEQAQKNELYSLDDRTTVNFPFSHLYTALSRTEYCEYLGLPRDWRSKAPVEDPIQPENFEKLHKVLVWLFGSKSEDKKPVIRTQNPDLARLGKVITDVAAHAALESGEGLEVAYLRLSPGDELFAVELMKADMHLNNAMKHLANHGEGMEKTADDVYKKATLIRNTISSAKQEA